MIRFDKRFLAAALGILAFEATVLTSASVFADAPIKCETYIMNPPEAPSRRARVGFCPKAPSCMSRATVVDGLSTTFAMPIARNGAFSSPTPTFRVDMPLGDTSSKCCQSDSIE